MIQAREALVMHLEETFKYIQSMADYIEEAQITQTAEEITVRVKIK
jgi:hypothetical protein